MDAVKDLYSVCAGQVYFEDSRDNSSKVGKDSQGSNEARSTAGDMPIKEGCYSEQSDFVIELQNGPGSAALIPCIADW